MPQIQFTNHKRQNLHTTLVHTVHTSHSTIQHSNKKVFTNHKLKQVNHQKKKRSKSLTSPGTTSHGPLGPLTNTKTPHGQHSAVSTSKHQTK